MSPFGYVPSRRVGLHYKIYRPKVQSGGVIANLAHNQTLFILDVVSDLFYIHVGPFRGGNAGGASHSPLLGFLVG